MAIDPATATVSTVPQRPPYAVRPPVASSPVASPMEPQASSASRWAARDTGAEYGGPAVAEEEMSFWDFLDVVNPLQHIPLVSDAYRAITGDGIKPAAEVAGGILYGGVVGGLAAIANAVLEEATGDDLGGHVMATLGFGDETPTNGPANGPAVAPGAMTAALTNQPPRRGEEASGRPATATDPRGRPDANPAVTAGVMPGGVPAGVPAGEALSAALAAKRPPQAPSGREAADETARAIAASGHVPSKMPKRDAMLTTTMPRGAQTLDSARLSTPQMPAPSLGPASGATASGKPGSARVAADGTPPDAVVPATPAAAKPASGKPVAAKPASDRSTAPGGQPIVVPRESMAEIMMRNLDKYRDIKRNEAAAPTIRSSI